ncbi:MAG TPA: glycosyltransferase [Pyrinomonadaceae bacterium]|nr:glycosyltransferase [Pyrinomonadaceae bacterium]
MKFALISHVLPPDWGGQTIMLHRLLEGLSGDDYCLLSGNNYAPEVFRGNYSRRLPAPYYQITSGFQLTRGYRYGLRRLRESVNVPLGLVARARSIAEIIRRENCRAVIACSGELLDLPAGYLASRLVGVPFYAYIFDYYSYQHLNPVDRFFATRFEPFVLKGAAGVIVPNEVLRDELRARYGVDSTVIHNPCDIEPYESLPAYEPAGDGEVRIAYTGAVYDAHYDAFRNLVAAINLLGRPNVKLHLYSASPVDWEGEGISGPAVVHHGHQELSAMPGIQRQADILFLPLALRSPYPVLVKTSATSKMGEYLAARQPILVHAPKGSFLSVYFRRHDCGVVVDEDDPSQLAEGIERIVNDEGLRRKLSAKAWERAQTDFTIATAQVAFDRLLKLERGARG